MKGQDFYLKGRLDEPRLSTTIRSANWIKTEHNSQKPGSTFLSVGSEEVL